MRYQSLKKLLYNSNTVEKQARDYPDDAAYKGAVKSKIDELEKNFALDGSEKLSTEILNNVLSAIHEDIVAPNGTSKMKIDRNLRKKLGKVAVPYVRPIAEEKKAERAEVQQKAHDEIILSLKNSGLKRGQSVKETDNINSYKRDPETKPKYDKVANLPNIARDFIKVEGGGYLNYIVSRETDTYNLVSKTLTRYIDVCNKFAEESKKNKMSDKEFVDYITSDHNLDSYEVMADLTSENIDKLISGLDLVEDKFLTNLVKTWKNKYADIAPLVKDEIYNRLAYIANPMYNVASREDFYAMNNYIELSGVKDYANSNSYDIVHDLTDYKYFYNEASKIVENDVIMSNDSRKIEGIDNKESSIKRLTNNVKAYSKFYLDNHPELTAKDMKIVDLDESNGEVISSIFYNKDKDYEKMAERLLMGHKITFMTETGVIKSQITMDPVSGKCVEKDINTLYMSQSGLGFIDEVAKLVNGVNDVNKMVYKPTKEFTDMANKLNELKDIDYNNRKAYNAKIQDIVKDAKAYIANKKSTTKAFTAKTYKRIEMAQKVIDALDGCGTYFTKAYNIAKDNGRQGEYERELKEKFNYPEETYNIRGVDYTDKDFENMEKAYDEKRKAGKSASKDIEWTDDILASKLEKESGSKSSTTVKENKKSDLSKNLEIESEERQK